jgi:hypothetical protein
MFSGIHSLLWVAEQASSFEAFEPVYCLGQLSIKTHFDHGTTSNDCELNRLQSPGGRCSQKCLTHRPRRGPQRRGLAPLQSQQCADEEQQSDRQNRETMERQFPAGVKLDGVGPAEQTSASRHEKDQNVGKAVNVLARSTCPESDSTRGDGIDGSESLSELLHQLELGDQTGHAQESQ